MSSPANSRVAQGFPEPCIPSLEDMCTNSVFAVTLGAFEFLDSIGLPGSSNTAMFIIK